MNSFESLDNLEKNFAGFEFVESAFTFDKYFKIATIAESGDNITVVFSLVEVKSKYLSPF